MKKLLLLITIGILILSSVESVAVQKNETNDVKIKTESIAISDPIINDKGQYVAVNVQEATSFLLDIGKPILPVVTKVLTFPFGTKIHSVEVNFFDKNELVLLKEINPAPELTPVDENVVNEPIKDVAVYDDAALYPTRGYSYKIGAGLDGTEHVIYLSINCYPVLYSSITHTIYYTKNAEIKITYEEPKAPTLFLDQYDLVIIAPSEFLNQLQPLIDHKISMGMKTFLKTTEDIYSGYSGWDNAEKIKYFIKDAIETWGIDYVLLVGGVTKLPIRTSYASFWEETTLTDLYYADIYDENGSFCSWDLNANGKFGEVYQNAREFYDIDGVDLYPDVIVGRLPCENSTEVTIVVDKILYYETKTYGESWFQNMIFVGGDTFPHWRGNEGEELNLMNEQIMSEFEPIQLWTSDGTFTAESLNEAINNGAGFIDYSGHGFEIGIATHPPNRRKWIPYHTNHLIGATNAYKLPIVFFDACLTAKLDFDVSDLIAYLSHILSHIIDKFTIGSTLLPCFAWSCVAKSNGGCIATIGATRTAYGGIDNGAGKMSIEFFSAYNSSDFLGQMMTQMQNKYITDVPDDLFTVEEFILIGDPSLKIGGYPS